MAVVLVIEDEVNVAAMIRVCVDSEGHTCHVAHNGNEGLDKFSQLQPDVVILDLMLPGINGLEICAHIRQFIKSKQKDPYRTHLTSFTVLKYSYGKSRIQQPCRTLAA